jgi:hypothetical protein
VEKHGLIFLLKAPYKEEVGKNFGVNRFLSIIMIQARALFYALVVSFLIALISGLLISLSHLQRLQQIDQNQHARLNRNVKSGINLLLGSLQDEIPVQYVDVYHDGEDSIIIAKKSWGMFSAASVAAFAQTIGGKDTLGRSILIGEKPLPNSYPALYLADRNFPLSLSGHTAVRGTAYLPAAGVKRSSIGGSPYVGTQLIYGAQQRSGAELWAVSKSSILKIQNYFSQPSEHQQELSDSLRQPFTQSTIIISGQSVQITTQELAGNIIVKANGEITVHRGSQLDGILLFAPKIIFKAGFKGEVQAFATDSIIVEEGCSLTYPSVLGLLQCGRSLGSVSLNIGNSCDVKGLVFAAQATYFRKQPLVSIGEKTTVTGLVWVDGLLELRGTVLGSVQCKLFNLTLSGGVHQNHLLNATIDQNGLPKGFVGPFFNDKKSKKAIAKWID